MTKDWKKEFREKINFDPAELGSDWGVEDIIAEVDGLLEAKKQAFKEMVESHKLDDRPEITEWIVKTKAETKAHNSALDDVLEGVEKI
jgi:hypothetical protein